ncbi:hypothetical protein Goslar_00064 [Escherichia phage vB_EcoM_Goslar]|uniref:Uncharacterized protein n=1 Tax=Escherichia phage vB_EcoM_Goslar TaxID=2502409 RepID=A0A482GFU7_BPGOS|nr:hypothetical protein HOV27_gp064 [Escherichia phage vB_EcoM_Goslar]QBO63857.1 hypothetical protein Goslar_00064 [Escherichia phage vB_EcoM_Goslar]
MNKYLAAGLSSADNGLLVLESLTDGINSTPRTTTLNGAFLDDLLALKETLHREQQVSRQQLSMLSLSMPEALDGKPLALWTELPSTTGFREACQIVDKAITLMESKLKQEGNGQLVTLLRHELERLDNHKEDDETFNTMMVDLSQQLGELHQTLQGVIEHPDVIEDMGYAIQRHADKLAAVWSPALPIIAHSQALATLVQADTNILQQMLDLQAADVDIPMSVENQDISALERFMDGDGCLLPIAPTDCPTEWSLKDLLNYIGTGVFAARILRDVCQQYGDVAERVKQVIAKAEGLAQDSTLDGIAQLNLLTQMQCVRIKYQRMFAQSVRAALLFAQTVGQIILDVKDTAIAAKSDDFWDKTQAEVEAADGYTRTDLVQEGFFDPTKMEGYGIYTAESAWETLRRTMEYTVNILKRLVDWLVKSWRNGSAKAAIQQAEANNSQLTRAKDALLTEGTKKRLASLHTVGIQTIAKYAEAGTIWSGAFKGVTDNLGNVSALISSEVKELSNGRELDQDKLAKIREGLTLAFEKGNFNKVLLGHDGITIDNLASEIHDYREELKDQFKESTNESIDVDKLIRYNDGCRKFLQGPITDARNKVSGHELDNLLTMLNSMIRQQASSPENKGLGALKNEIVNARDLAKAAVDILGIAQWLEVRAKRYINALSTVVDKANSEAAAVSGTLKQEAFDLNEVVLSSTNYDVCSVAATSLAANRFRNSRDELRRHYNQALEAALQVYNRAVYNRAVIGQHLLGVMPRFTGVFSNYPWTLGLDLQVSNPSALNAFCEKLSRSIELYGAGTADSITQAVALLDSTELCYAVDPNYEGESGNSSALATHMFEYRRLAKEALEPHSDFTTEEQRRGWYATFMDSSPSWEPDNTLPVVTEDVDPSLIWAFASLFCAALNAYIALKYGTDLKVYGWFSEQQNSNNVR